MKFEVKGNEIQVKDNGTVVANLVESKVWVRLNPELYLTGDELIELGKFVNKQKNNHG